MKIKLFTFINSKIQRFNENKISKYFKIHDELTYPTEACNQLYAMREAIASYAKKNNLTVDIYNPEYLEKNFNNDIKFNDVDLLLQPHIGIVVTNKDNRKFASTLINAQTWRVYPKESIQLRLIPVNGEENLQVSKKVKSTRIDTFLQHVFRTIEDLQKATKSA